MLPLHIACFNSKMVRLKAVSELIGDHTEIGFKSKMVRLKEETNDNPEDPRKMFQFQNGSIKRILK